MFKCYIGICFNIFLLIIGDVLSLINFLRLYYVGLIFFFVFLSLTSNMLFSVYFVGLGHVSLVIYCSIFVVL